MICKRAKSGFESPQVKTSNAELPFSGQVCIEIWLSDNKATIVTPCGLNLWEQISNRVAPAISIDSLINSIKTFSSLRIE